MYAVVEIQGSQFKVSKDQKLYVNRIDAKEGSKVSFDNVLLVDDGKKVHVGKPSLPGTSVEAKIISHLKIDVPSYNLKNIPKSLKSIPITTPGSRFIK